LSAEEIGFLLDQLPQQQVEFSRRLMTNTTGGDVPDKVMRITPAEGGQFSFLVDFQLNGAGGHVVDNNVSGPLEVVAQLGEFQVMRELMQRTIPVLVGWETQLQFAMDWALQDAYRTAQTSPQQSPNSVSRNDLPF
jgi:hypothetical protein